MTHIEITDATGARWVGDSTDEVPAEADLDGLYELLSNFSGLNHLSLEIGGTKHYFNPAHIVAVSLHGVV